MNTQNSEVILSDEQYVNKLADLNSGSANDFSLLSEGVKEGLDAKEAELVKFLGANTDFENYSPEKRDELYDSAIKIWNEYKDLVKQASCKMKCNGVEIRTIDKKLHQSIDYTTETLFYGIHLKKYFVDNLPKVKQDYDAHEITITFSNVIALYHILSTLTVRGLNKENYALAHVLHKLSEISKLYQHFDSVSARMNKSIMEWNMGLSKPDAEKLNKEIAKQVISESVNTAEAVSSEQQ